MAGVGLHSMTAALLQRMCGAKEQQSGRSIRSTAAITVHIWMTPQKDAGGRDGSGRLYSERPTTAHAGENRAEERGYNKKHAGFSQMKNPRVSAGAGSGTRTHTVSPPTDFESVTSTNSITPANGYWFIIQEAEAKFKSFFSRPDTVPLRPQDDPPGPAAVGVVLVHPAAVLAGGDQAAAAGIPGQDGPGVRVVLL